MSFPEGLKKERYLCYLFVWILSSILLLPFLVFALFRPKLRRNLAERFGFGEWLKDERFDCWVHGASVGEFQGIEPLLSHLHAEIGQNRRVLVTTTSLTGRERAARSKGVSSARLLPFDHPLLVRSALKRVRPELILIMETEIWPALFLEAERLGIPIVVANGRISDASYPWYLNLKKFFGVVLSSADMIFVQSEEDRVRYQSLAPEHDRILVLGSTKFDDAGMDISPEQRQSFVEDLGLDIDKPIFVAGSVREGEDVSVLDAYLKARLHCPELQLLIAPRHPERFEAVASLIDERRIEFVRRSDESNRKAGVLLLDSLGELKQAYSIARVAFVGGTLVQIGGHNPFEPAQYSVPIIVGQYTENYRACLEALRRGKAVFEVSDAAELEDAIVLLVQDRSLAERIGASAKIVWQQSLGASERVSKYIRPYFSEQFDNKKVVLAR